MTNHNPNQDDRLPEERMEGEPDPEDFYQDEPKPPKKPKWWVRIGAIVVSVLLIANAGAFLLQHFGQDSRDLVSQSEELAGNELEEYKSTVVSIQRGQSRGTGFFYNDQGSILTNHHVAEGHGPLIVTTLEGEKYQGEIEAQDEKLDLAKISIQSDKDHPYLPLSQEPAHGEDQVYIIGNPLTQNQILIKGQIVDQQQQYEAVQIEATIFQGHSGSPVISEAGQVLGVVYARTIPGFLSEEDSVGLAVPIQRVHEFLE